MSTEDMIGVHIAAKMSTEDMIGVQMSDKGNDIYEGYKKRMEDLRKNVAGSLGVHVKLRNVQKEFGTISLLSNSSTLGEWRSADCLPSLVHCSSAYIYVIIASV